MKKTSIKTRLSTVIIADDAADTLKKEADSQKRTMANQAALIIEKWASEQHPAIKRQSKG